MIKHEPRDLRTEATTLLGPGKVGLVLEPSPPSVHVEPWFADNPVTPPISVDPAVIVSPVDTGDLSWEDAIANDERLAAFARDHWLVGDKPLPAPPASLGATRTSLTALAFNVLSPARQQTNGKIGLRWTKGGFGTPFFGDDRQVRVDGDHLVVQAGNVAIAAPITTLRAAGDLVGIAPGPPPDIHFHDPPDPIGLDALLFVDPVAVGFLDEWFGFGTLVLERLLVRAGSPEDTRVQLWAEHFDVAIEIGHADSGTRATYGVSAGDAATPTPYLYVSPWSPQTGPLWDAPFGGAALTLDHLLGTRTPVATALTFFERARQAIG